MADTCKWRGGATYETAQVDLATPGGTIEIGDVFNLTLTGENGDTDVVTYTAAATTVKDVCDGLTAAAIAAALDTDNLWTNVAVTDDDTACTITAVTAGIPFHLTIETTEAGGGAADAQTFVQSSSVLNVGPNDYGTAENWDVKKVPVSTDSVIIPDSDYSILYGLEQSAVLLASFVVDIKSKSAQKIGQKDEYLHIDADTVQYHSVGRSFIEIDNMTSDMVITKCGRSNTDGTYGLNLKGSNAGRDIHATLGSSQSMGIAYQEGESCTFVELLVAGGSVYVGDTTGMTIIVASRGCNLYCKEDLDTSLDVKEAIAHVLEGTPAIITARDGQIFMYATGTHPQFHLYGASRLDFTMDNRPKTVSLCDVYSESVQIKDPNGVVTWSNGWDFPGCKRQGSALDLPANMNHPAPSAL